MDIEKEIEYIDEFYDFIIKENMKFENKIKNNDIP